MLRTHPLPRVVLTVSKQTRKGAKKFRSAETFFAPLRLSAKVYFGELAGFTEVEPVAAGLLAAGLAAAGA